MSEQLLVDLFFDRLTVYVIGFIIMITLAAIVATVAKEAVKTWQHGRRERGLTEEIRQRVAAQQAGDYDGPLRREGTSTRDRTGFGDRQRSRPPGR